jgi:hypothetical protein
MLRSKSFGLNPVAVRPRFIAVKAMPGSLSDEPLRYGWLRRDTLDRPAHVEHLVVRAERAGDRPEPALHIREPPASATDQHQLPGTGDEQQIARVELCV